MKKHNKKTSILFVTISILITGFLFSACDGVIFDEIRKEVKLADAKIAGDIQNIIRFNYGGEECVFVTNGKIRYRSVEPDVVDNKGVGFSDFSSPSGYVYSIAADTDNLYAMSATIEEDDDGYNAVTKRTLYCYDSGSWTQIWSEAYSTKRAFIICTNGQTKREAYFVYGLSVYKLSGSSTTIDTSSTSYVYADGNFPIGKGPVTTADPSKTPLAVNSCTSLGVGGTVYFSSAYAMTSAKTSTSGETAYYSDGAYVYYSTDGSSWVPVNLGCDTILSLTITNNYLLAGTSDGIVHTPINVDTNTLAAVPSSGTADFSTNADSALSSYYEIPALLAIDPKKNETAGTIYASSITSSSSASLNNVGLWSYYASTGEWNRE
ncbi:hypothetical protein [Treponema sp. UBA3813]|uniref:hypothetical protein n=1 Tax=Treponema sp. UBA3813 TaxID=1947715 RepID=UPI0025D2F010|nr:hypothetical protein [Treponema sp. UBA3813]